MAGNTFNAGLESPADTSPKQWAVICRPARPVRDVDTVQNLKADHFSPFSSAEDILRACVAVIKATVENNVNNSVAHFSIITPLIPVAAH